MAESNPQEAARNDMDRAVMALALELPASVWDDVKRRWDAVRPFVAALASLPEEHPGPGGAAMIAAE
ncbi:MAG: hypothetical protein AB7G37_06440, partial [Solirubrobacteraceae bacterium]